MATRLRSEAPRPPGLTGAQRRDDGVNSAGPNASGKTRETVISNELTIEGTVRSEGVVRLEGMLLGDIDCASFTLEPTGEMHGKIFAEEVSLRGKHSGPVKGGKVMLTSSAEVKGDISHDGIAIEMGARYEGRLKTLKPTKAKTRRKTKTATENA